MKVLILTTQKDLLSYYDTGNIASHSNWGMVELCRKYGARVKPVGNIIQNTKTFVAEDFDILFMHNMNPFRILPLQLLRLFPSIRRKRVVCLCHASIFGKSHSPSSFVMKTLGGG